MRVDLGEMRAGADRSYQAAWLAMQGADRLSRATVRTGIFGDFEAAEAFGDAVGESHSNHLRRLGDHQSRLGVLGDRAHTTASVFVDMEERNAQALRSVL